MKERLFLSLFCGLAACGDVPRDPEGTWDSISRSGVIRIGVANDEAAASGTIARSRAFLTALDAQTGARSRVVEGATEPLLLRLEDGRLDIVLAPFAADTPWAQRASLGPILAEEWVGEARHQLRPAMRNGENAWIGRVHRAAMVAGGTPG